MLRLFPWDTRKVFEMNKKYNWCFMGQIHEQGKRAEMINFLKKTGGDYFCNTNNSWQSKDSLNLKEYKSILANSIFAPCPRGNSCVDTFRLYEAIEAGAIPLVEKDEYWENLFGKDHPLIEVTSWEKTAHDISILSLHPEWINNRVKKIADWWFQYKKYLIEKIIKITKRKYSLNTSLKLKQDQLIKITNQWVNFKDYDFLKYIHQEMPKPEMPKEKFSVYNPGKSIAIVSLYTPEISDYAVYSEQNIKKYCEKNNYTFYVYREKIEQNSSPNWSKAQAILNHFDDHDDIVWMDSDTLVFNPEKKFEDILSRCTKTKKIVACEDIGTNNKNLPKGSMFNSGVIIFRNHNYTKNILKKWRDFDGDKSSLYASGGDQEILCEILKKSDGFGHNRKIFPMNQFNTEPRMINNETFIIHFMAYPIQLKTIFMKYFVSS